MGETHDSKRLDFASNQPLLCRYPHALEKRFIVYTDSPKEVKKKTLL